MNATFRHPHSTSLTMVNAKRLSISGKKDGEVIEVDFRPQTSGAQPPSDDDLRKLCRNLLLDTFQGCSFDQIAKEAAIVCKTSRSTIKRLLGGHTDKPDLGVMIKALLAYQKINHSGYPMGRGLYITIGYVEDWE